LNTRQGFSIVEIIVAMVIIATISAGFSALFVSAKREAVTSGDKIQATSFGRAKLEEFDTGGASSGSETVYFSDGRNATRTWTVIGQDWDGDTINDSYYINVTITWQR
jgi:prepilin-type N-terminal cleavage/methylation domain-containing protein